MYKSIDTRIGISPTQAQSLMAKGGINRQTLPQFLDTNFALNVENYFVKGEGQLQKRGGLDLIKDIASQTGSLLEEFTEDIFLIAYGTTLIAYELSTDTITTIKNDFSTNNGFDGERAGDYFLICNKVDRIYRISRTLAYDGQTTNFTVGDIVTGGTSGATAVILEDSDAGATGTLTLGSISGVFEDNEALTGESGGDGNANGVVTWAATLVSGSPICGGLRLIGSRMHAFNLKDDPSAQAYSEIDDGSNPPYTNWTVSTNADSPGEVNYRSAGQINSVEPLGQYIVSFHEKGKSAFYINTIDSAGTLKKVDVFQMSREDFGGARGAINTPKGLFYVNEKGLFQLISVGQTDQPFSNQEKLTSRPLGNDYFDDVNLSNASLIYDPKRDYIYLACAKDSSANNIVIAYGVESKAFSVFTGMNIARFMRSGEDIYAISSTGDLDLFKCFEGDDDNGSPIATEYYQEINMGSLYSKKSLRNMYVQGRLSPSSSIDIAFDIFDRAGNFLSDYKQLTWTPQINNSESDGYDAAEYDTSAYDGSYTEEDGLVNCFDGRGVRISNFNRIRIRFTSNDVLPHQINWFSLLGREKSAIRRRKLSLVS